MLSGGNIDYINSPDKLPKAKFILPVYATDTGFVKQIDADMVGSLARYLGAGRLNEDNEIDNTAGIILEKKMGDEVSVGEIVAYIHANDEEKAKSAVTNLADAFIYSGKPVAVKSRVLEVYGI